MSAGAVHQRALRALVERELVAPGVEAVLQRAVDRGPLAFAYALGVDAGLPREKLLDRAAGAFLLACAARCAIEPDEREAAGGLQMLLHCTAVDVLAASGVPAVDLASASRLLGVAVVKTDDAPSTAASYLDHVERTAGHPHAAFAIVLATGTALAVRADALGRALGIVQRVGRDLHHEDPRLVGLPREEVARVVERAREMQASIAQSAAKSLAKLTSEVCLVWAEPPIEAGGGREILIVEDDAVLARVLARRIASTCPTRIVGTIEAVRALRAEGKSWAGAIVDIRLPDGSGLDLLESLRGDGWDGPALVLTGHLAPELVNRASKLRATYVVKPAPDENLRSFLAELSRGERNVADVTREYAERYRLTPGERRILELSVRGVSREAIADKIGVTENTLKTQVRSLLTKIPGAFQLGDVTRRIWSEASAGESGGG